MYRHISQSAGTVRIVISVRNPGGQKQTEDNVIQGTIRVKKDGWFITSIPYDKHFKIYIDGKKQRYKSKYGISGCKIESGNHEVKIIYHAPGTTTGKVLSLIGIAGFVLSACTGKRNKKYKVVYVDIYIQQQICGKLLLYICIL